MVLEDAAKQEDVMIILGILLDGCHNGASPVKDQLLEAIPLIQEGEEILLHGLPRLSVRLALLVVFALGVDYLVDHLPGLLQ